MTTLNVFGPSTAMMAIPKRMAGNAIMASMTRMMGLSSRGKYPESRPKRIPAATVSSMTAAPTSRDSRAPWSTRLKMSRPKLSVPIRCVTLGDFIRSDTIIVSGS